MKHFITALFFFALSLFIACKDIDPTDGDKPPCPPTLIVPNPAYTDPIWHPSGKFIGFNHTPLDSITYPNGEQCQGRQNFNWRERGFWLMDTDGTNMRRIFPYELLCPAWSPDGEWIAFTLWGVGGGAQIFKMRFTDTGFDTTSLTRLTLGGENFFPTWSPDGQWIAYDMAYPEGYAGIYIRSANDMWKDLRKIGNGRFPDWSSDGRRIVYVTRVVIRTGPGERDTKVIGDSIWIFDTNSNANIPVTLLSDPNYDNRLPKFSPAGTQIAFWSQPNPGAGNLWMMDTLGNNLHKLTTEGVDASFGRPFSWNPSGEKIVFTHYDEKWTCDNGVFWLLDMQTSMKQQLTFNCRSSPNE